MVSHSVTQKSNPAQTPAPQNWSVLTSQDCLGPLYFAQESCYDAAAMNEKQRWSLVVTGLSEDEAKAIRADLYSGELTLEDFAAADAIPDDVPQSSQPRRACDIPNFNWYVLSEFDFPLYYLVYLPTDADTPRWVSCVEAIGYEADIEFWQEDIDFLNDLLNLEIPHSDFFFITPVEICARSASPHKQCLKGVGHIWLKTHAVGRADWLAGNTAAIIVSNVADNGHKESPGFVTTVTNPETAEPENTLSDDGYPGWFPPVAGGRERPRFISATGQVGD